MSACPPRRSITSSRPGASGTPDRQLGGIQLETVAVAAQGVRPTELHQQSHLGRRGPREPVPAQGRGPGSRADGPGAALRFRIASRVRRCGSSLASTSESSSAWWECPHVQVELEREVGEFRALVAQRPAERKRVVEDQIVHATEGAALNGGGWAHRRSGRCGPRGHRCLRTGGTEATPAQMTAAHADRLPSISVGRAGAGADRAGAADERLKLIDHPSPAHPHGRDLHHSRSRPRRAPSSPDRRRRSPGDLVAGAA